MYYKEIENTIFFFLNLPLEPNWCQNLTSSSMGYAPAPFHQVSSKSAHTKPNGGNRRNITCLAEVMKGSMGEQWAVHVCPNHSRSALTMRGSHQTQCMTDKVCTLCFAGTGVFLKLKRRKAAVTVMGGEKRLSLVFTFTDSFL